MVAVPKTAIAKRLNINRDTIYEWLKLPKVKAYYEKQLYYKRKELREEIKDFREGLRAILPELKESITDILLNPDNVQYSTFGKVLEMVLKAVGVIEDGNKVIHEHVIIMKALTPEGKLIEIAPRIQSWFEEIEPGKRESVMSKLLAATPVESEFDDIDAIEGEFEEIEEEIENNIEDDS